MWSLSRVPVSISVVVLLACVLFCFVAVPVPVCVLAQGGDALGEGSPLYGTGPCDPPFVCCPTFPCVPPPDTTHITVGLADPTSRPGLYFARAAFNLAVDRVNKEQWLGHNTTLVVVLADTRGTGDGGLRAVQKLGMLGLASGSVVKRVPLILGPDTSSSAEVACLFTSQMNIPTLSGSASSPNLSDRNLYSLFSRLIPSDAYQGVALADFVNEMGWTRVATICNNDVYGQMLVAAFATQAVSLGITVLTSVTYETGSDPTTALQLLQSSGARIILNACSYPGAFVVVRTAYAMGITGIQWLAADSWTIVPPDIPSPINSDGIPLYTGVLGVAFNIDTDTPQYADLFQRWTKKYQENPTFMLNVSAPEVFATTVYDTILFLALALNATLNMGSRDPNILFNETLLTHNIRNQTMLGTTGYIQLSEQGERFGSYMLRNGVVDSTGTLNWNKVGVYSPSTDPMSHGIWNITHDIIWREGTTSPPVDQPKLVQQIKHVSQVSVIGISVFSALVMLLCLICTLFNNIYRHKRIIKLSSPNVNNVILVGIILVAVACGLLGLDAGSISSPTYTSICSVRLWFFSLSFTWVFGPMFSKTYRVKEIFLNPKLVQQPVTDSHLFFIIALLTLIDILLLSIWTGIDPLIEHLSYATPRQDPNNRDQLIVDVTQACSNTHTLPFYASLFAYKGLLLLMGTYLALEVRNVHFETINDTKMIGICIYNIAVIVPVVLILSFVFPSEIQFSYLFTSIVILLAAIITLALLFGAKALDVFSGSSSRSGPTSIVSGTRPRRESQQMLALQQAVRQCTCSCNADIRQEMEKFLMGQTNKHSNSPGIQHISARVTRTSGHRHKKQASGTGIGTNTGTAGVLISMTPLTPQEAIGQPVRFNLGGSRGSINLRQGTVPVPLRDRVETEPVVEMETPIEMKQLHMEQQGETPLHG